MSSKSQYKLSLEQVLKNACDKGYDIHIPEYLLVSIKEFIEQHNNQMHEAYASYGDVRSGINIAEANYDLTPDEADFLREEF